MHLPQWEVSMKIRLLVGLLGAGICLGPMALADHVHRRRRTMTSDMRRAIEFERAKARADARQARLEARHPSVSYSSNSANRTDESESSQRGRTVHDPGERQYGRDKR
jgi:hypothetical protein